MITMLDSAVPGVTTMALTIDPTTIGVLVALLAAVAWLVSGAAAELRHEPPTIHIAEPERLAA